MTWLLRVSNTTAGQADGGLFQTETPDGVIFKS